MGPIRIAWYLERYHDINTSDATVCRVCKRHGMARLPNRVGRRAAHTHRYQKQVPGHHVQVAVKFLTLKRKKGSPVRRLCVLNIGTPWKYYAFPFSILID